MTTTDHNLKLRVLLAACWLAWHGREVQSVDIGPGVTIAIDYRDTLVCIWANDEQGVWAQLDEHGHEMRNGVLTIFDIDPLCTALTST